jgi:hypothetical protein
MFWIICSTDLEVAGQEGRAPVEDSAGRRAARAQ